MSFPLRTLCLVASLCAATGAFAQEESSVQLRERASAIRDAANAQYKQVTYDCYDKFFVNACLDDARVELITQVKEARLLEARANRIDRGERIKAMEARLRKVENRPESSPADATTANDGATPAPR